ncbi:MAG: Uncharacterized protein FD147_2179 [Chloroflexi bacterium]|nr:MAG: Uncharacterized protein FD147_2179 [Chloroflexota bacterium]
MPHKVCTPHSLRSSERAAPSLHFGRWDASRTQTVGRLSPTQRQGEKDMSKKTLFLLIVLAFAFSSCQPVTNNDFAIYLLSKDTSTFDLAQVDINQLDIETEPIISIEDIVSYDKTNHVIELTPEGITRAQQILPMPVKVDGIPFVVCVGKERIYTGAFWSLHSSLIYDGVVILQPFDTAETTIQITLGYPGQDFFTGNDPRADSRIMITLEQSKKLK